MHVVERSLKPHTLAEQHAVAEDVTTHVPDAGHGDRVLLRVQAHLTEVAPDADPGPLCGDAVFLVVVARGTTRGKGVVQPEAILRSDGVRSIGEVSSSLVRRDDEVGVVRVVAND